MTNNDVTVGEGDGNGQTDVRRSPSSLPVFQSSIKELDAIEKTLQAIAQQHEGDTLALLSLLRRLESVHVHIRDTLFQASLPNNRQRLYALLRDIEVEGGWPYIPRMKLQRLLAHFLDDDAIDKP